jgi:hypothetical protein
LKRLRLCGVEAISRARTAKLILDGKRKDVTVTPATLQTYLRAEPFRPFRVIMNSGKTYDIRHPELVRLGKDFFNYYYATPPDAPAERWETVSLLVVQNIQHLEEPAKPATGNGPA